MSSQIDFHRFSRGESCTEEGCRARKWYIQDGKKFCQHGHEQAGFTQTQQDEDDWNNQGRKVRKKREEKERVQTILSGYEARELYLRCYQLVLWKQCHWLVTVKKFPAELETVVRDLWGLRLRILHEERGDEDGFGSGVSVVGFSDTSEGETGSDATDGRSLWSGRSRKIVAGKNEKLPKLIESIALCYLGTLLMNLPTSLGEIFKWASTEEMVFTRAIKEVPKEMRTKLPAHYHSALEIHAPLTGSAVYSTVMELVGFYNLYFEMVFPSLNTSLLLIKHMRDLGLPVEIYPEVRRLAALLDIDFTYSISPKGGHRKTAYPEVRLMSLIVVATKLSQPFDSIKRYPESDSDSSTVRIDWSEWAKAMAEPLSDGLQRGQEIHVTDKDVFGMSEKQMDDYLDSYQRTWIDDRDSKIADQILELFPLQEVPKRKTEDSEKENQIKRLKQAQQQSTIWKSMPVKEDDEENVTRLGEHYRRYRTAEELPMIGTLFYEEAAKNIGVNVDKLVRAVFATELLLDNWSLADRKRRLIDMRQNIDLEDY